MDDAVFVWLDSNNVTFFLKIQDGALIPHVG
jgi:hypothetical protein